MVSDILVPLLLERMCISGISISCIPHVAEKKEYRNRIFHIQWPLLSSRPVMFQNHLLLRKEYLVVFFCGLSLMGCCSLESQLGMASSPVRSRMLECRIWSSCFIPALRRFNQIFFLLTNTLLSLDSIQVLELLVLQKHDVKQTH